MRLVILIEWGAEESQWFLAEEVYDTIRVSPTDIKEIAKNTNCKEENIQKVKDHVFNNEHDLNKYEGDNDPPQRFDASLQQGLAWARFKSNQYTSKDITWMKHEFAEQHHESKFNLNYAYSSTRTF